MCIFNKQISCLALYLSISVLHDPCRFEKHKQLSSVIIQHIQLAVRIDCLKKVTFFQSYLDVVPILKLNKLIDL